MLSCTSGSRLSSQCIWQPIVAAQAYKYEGFIGDHGDREAATRLHLHVLTVHGFACRVDLPGGQLHIEWREADDHVYMTGPAERVFTGSLQL
jgi:hypothetical protein